MAPLLSLLATPPGVVLATCFTAGSHINTALAPKLGKLYTAIVNAKDTVNKEASASNIKGTQGNAMYF